MMVTRFWPWFLSMMTVCFGFPNFLYREAHQSILKPVTSWPQSGVTVGQVGGVAVDSNNDVYIFHRADREWDTHTFNVYNTLADSVIAEGPIAQNTILKLSADGNVIDQFGANRFFVPHGLTVDKHGDLYVTDVGLHQVMRLTNGGDTISLELGERMVPGEDGLHFCKPTDVAVMADGSFFVADGYCNSRIMHFSAEGKVLKVIAKGNGADSHQYNFLVPHSLALVDNNKICVADRENRRIQCFDARTGNFVQSMSEGFGRIFAISYDKNDKVIHLVNTIGSQDRSIGFTINLNGTIKEDWQPNTGFGLAHDVAVSPSGKQVYVGEVWPKRVTKFSRN